MKSEIQNSRLRQDFGGQAKCKIIISFCIVAGLVSPGFIFAQNNSSQTVTPPQTVEEARDFGMKILSKLPDAAKRVFWEEALPFWQKMWEWAKPVIDPWLQKFLNLLGKEVEKRRPGLEQEFQKEKEEIQKDLWERFKDLLR